MRWGRRFRLPTPAKDGSRNRLPRSPQIAARARVKQIPVRGITHRTNRKVRKRRPQRRLIGCILFVAGKAKWNRGYGCRRLRPGKRSWLMPCGIHFRSAVLILAVPLLGFGQSDTAQVSGFVKDASGAGVSKAIIAVANEKTGLERRTTTNDSGYYIVTSVPTGTYTI